MIIRLIIVWIILHIGCLIYEIKQYRKSKQWGWKWWWENHICSLTQILVIADGTTLGLAVLYWIIFGFNFIKL